MRPHALLLPCPAQGHINPFAQLAQILVDQGVLVTFVNTEKNQRLMMNNAVAAAATDEAQALIRFKCFPDGLPPEHESALQLAETFEALKRNVPAHVERIMVESAALGDAVTVLICDGIFSFANEIARRHGIPHVAFQTTGACGLSAYLYMPALVAQGYIPLPEDKAAQRKWMERSVTCIPGMNTLRVKDLVSFCLVTDTDDYVFQYLQNEAQQLANADLILLNTWQDLELPVLADLAKQFPGKLLPVGPLALQQRCNGAVAFETSLWGEDGRCLDWLDGHREAPGSVIYVSFGSITVMTESKLAEFAWGLAATGRPFLWVLRPDAVRGEAAAVTLAVPPVPAEFVEATGDRGLLVAWAPQRKILQHPAVGGFLTHSGWNSTLEGLCAGVPMLCWPFYAEQLTNRRFVSSVWSAGFEMEMEEEVRRDSVAAMVEKLMDRNDADCAAVRANAKKMRESAVAATAAGGSSDANLQRLLKLVLSSSSACCENAVGN